MVVRSIQPKGTAYDLEPLLTVLHRSRDPLEKALWGRFQKVKRYTLTLSEMGTCHNLLLCLLQPEKELGKPLSQLQSSLVHGLVTGFLCSYARAVQEQSRSRVGKNLKLEPEDLAIKNKLIKLRNKVFAHLDADLPEDLQGYHNEKFVMLHQGFGYAQIRFLISTKFFGEQYLLSVYDHVWRVIRILQTQYEILIVETSEQLKDLTINKPEIGNLIEAEMFDAQSFFKSDLGTQSFLSGEELKHADALSLVNVVPEEN